MANIRQIEHRLYSWVVDWLGEDGKRRRKFFRAKGKALAWWEVLRREVDLMPAAEAPISAQERAAVLLARREGVGLEEAVLDFVRRRRSAVRVFTLGELVAHRLEEARRAKRSPRYLIDLTRIFGEVVAALGARAPVDGLHADKLVGLVYLEAAASTVEKRRAIIYGLFEMAKMMRMIEANPVAELSSISPDVDGEVGILTVEEARELWAACLEVGPRLAPWLAIAMWGGLRRAEIERLEWEAVRFDTGVIHVGARLAKNRQRRLVTMELPLRLALEGWEGSTGRIWPANGTHLWDVVRRAAGWRRRTREEGRAWPHNALRHSFVTYHLAFFKDAARTALEAGHGQDVMFRHYRELATTEAAEGWWCGWVRGEDLRAET